MNESMEARNPRRVREFTAMQIVDGIISAMKAGRADVAEGLIVMLGVQYPEEYAAFQRTVAEAAEPGIRLAREEAALHALILAECQAAYSARLAALA